MNEKAFHILTEGANHWPKAHYSTIQQLWYYYYHWLLIRSIRSFIYAAETLMLTMYTVV